MTVSDAILRLEKLKKKNQSVSETLRDELLTLLRTVEGQRPLYATLEYWEGWPQVMSADEVARLQGILDKRRDLAQKDAAQ